VLGGEGGKENVFQGGFVNSAPCIIEVYRAAFDAPDFFFPEADDEGVIVWVTSISTTEGSTFCVTARKDAWSGSRVVLRGASCGAADTCPVCVWASTLFV